MTIETWLDHHEDDDPHTEIITLKRGTFGPTGHRVRLLVIKDGVLIEAGGETRYLKAEPE